MAEKKRSAMARNLEPLDLSCFLCDYTTRVKSNLRRHMTARHDPEKPKVKPPRQQPRQYQCVLCSLYSSTSRDVMMAHYKFIHDVNINPAVFYDFINWDAFLAWKSSIEKQEVNHYVVTSRKPHRVYYRCHRDGHYKHQGSGIRRLKMDGSIKINGCCPASITASKSADGSVRVQHISTHVGHMQEIGRLRITKVDRDSLAHKIALQLPLDTILDDIKTPRGSDLQRVHLVRRSDLKNIIRDYKLGPDYVRLRGDWVTVESWISEMQQTTNIVKLYKPQDLPSTRNGLRDSDFVLIVANDAQLECVLKFGTKFICVDRTCNAYGIEVTTLLTLDNSREGIPCASMISSRSDEEMMGVFFSVIRESVGIGVTSEAFMSDVADYFYKAWKAVMPCPEKRLYCSWNVDNVWRLNLKKVKTPEKKAYVYWLISAMLQEPDERAFACLLKEGLNELETHPDTSPFADYFRREFGSSIHCWAYCYRKHAGLNSDVNLEELHETVKHFFFDKQKKVRRLDQAINDLLRYAGERYSCSSNQEPVSTFTISTSHVTSNNKSFPTGGSVTNEVKSNYAENVYDVLGDSHEDQYVKMEASKSIEPANLEEREKAVSSLFRKVLSACKEPRHYDILRDGLETSLNTIQACQPSSSGSVENVKCQTNNSTPLQKHPCVCEEDSVKHPNKKFQKVVLVCEKNKSGRSSFKFLMEGNH